MYPTKNAAPPARRRSLRQIALGCLALICLTADSAGVSATAAPAPIVLYDGAQNNRPDDQGFTFLAVPSVSPTTAGGATILDTASNKNTFAGYFSKPTPQLVLDRAIGYTVSFTVQVELEDHGGSDRNGDGTEDRAGFSLIVLSSDTRGIELGFWKDRIWAQEDGATEPPLFTQAEHTVFDTQSGRIGYALAVQGDNYTLSSDGTPILSGRLRDYTNFVGTINPYKTPNLIFLGDDTSSASAKIQLAYVAVGPSLDRKVYLSLLMRL
ncbi:MAG: PEP-CTERM sorting domain-containing protein [Chloroflexota bacterium]|nr:PEP-CTERM sorting domain-containing protein [Chloroflexota bacterium]